MILAFDIGNTHITAVLFSTNGDILFKIRIPSLVSITEDMLFSYIHTSFLLKNISLSSISAVVVSSVVPSIDKSVIFMAEKYFNCSALFINSETASSFIKFDIEFPVKTGADRIVNMLQAVTEYNYNNIITVDMGTATTFELIKNRCYVGGCIIPGISLMLSSLSAGTAKLPLVELKKPDTGPAKESSAQINSGVYYGYLGQIKEILKHLKSEASDAFVIATGGNSNLFSEEVNLFNKIDPNLTLKGLFTFYKSTIK